MREFYLLNHMRGLCRSAFYSPFYLKIKKETLFHVLVADTGIDRDRVRAGINQDRVVQVDERRNPEDPTGNAPKKRANKISTKRLFHLCVIDVNVIECDLLFASRCEGLDSTNEKINFTQDFQSE